MRVALPSIVAIPLLAACVAPTPGAVRQVPDPVSTRYINPGTLAALPGFTHAVRIGPTLYVSGEVALDSTGRLVGPGDVAPRLPRRSPTLRRCCGSGARPQPTWRSSRFTW